MKKPGRNPALAITRFETLILPAKPGISVMSQFEFLLPAQSHIERCCPKGRDWSSPVISRHLFAGILPPIAELRPPPEAVIRSMSVNFLGKNSRP
jgi:hypothetical protein